MAATRDALGLLRFDAGFGESIQRGHVTKILENDWVEWPLAVMVGDVEAAGVARAKWNDLEITMLTPFHGLTDRDCRNGTNFGMATRKHPEKRFVCEGQPTAASRELADNLLATLGHEALSISRHREEITHYLQGVEPKLAKAAADADARRAPWLARRTQLRRAHKEGRLEQRVYQSELQEINSALAAIGLERKAIEQATDKAACAWSKTKIGCAVPVTLMRQVLVIAGQ